MTQFGKILILGFCFLCFMLACKETPLRDPGPAPVLKSTLTAWASSDSVAYKGNVTIYWQSENLSSLSINGRVFSELNGSVVITGLVKDTIFNFKGTSIDGLLLNKSINIKVGLAPVVVIIPTTAKDTLVSFVWRLTEERVKSEGIWYEIILGEARKTNHLHFYKNDEWEEFNAQNKRISGGEFEIKGDSLRMEKYWFQFLITSSDTTKFSRIRINGLDTTISVWTGYLN